MKPTLLILGGNGFLGYHIKNELEKNNINYLSPRSSEVDILNFNQLSDYLKYHKPTTILNMAAKCAGILGNKNNPAVFLRDNTQMALNVYEAARINNITNIHSLGSVCAYPANCPAPFKEDDIWNGYPEATNAPYSQGKRTLLMLGQTYREQFGFTGSHLIPVNMFGEYDKFDLINGHVIPSIIMKMVNAKKHNLKTVELFGTGNATREFLYVKDAAEVIVKAVMTNLDTDLPINLGTGKDISIRALSKLIAKIVGYMGEIVFNGSVSDGQKKRLLDVSRAKQMIGWEALTNLADGLSRTIRWYIEKK